MTFFYCYSILRSHFRSHFRSHSRSRSHSHSHSRFIPRFPVPCFKDSREYRLTCISSRTTRSCRDTSIACVQCISLSVFSRTYRDTFIDSSLCPMSNVQCVFITLFIWIWLRLHYMKKMLKLSILSFLSTSTI